MDSSQPTEFPDALAYTDSIDGNSIRLLRFAPSEHGEFVGSLRTFPFAYAPHFYTVSYVWGAEGYAETGIHVDTGVLPVLRSLAPFLHMVAHHQDFKPTDWWWIDSLCINLKDGAEREQQVRIMAEIYRRSSRAIVWLGQEREPDSDCTGAIEFLCALSSLKIAYGAEDSVMRQHLKECVRIVCILSMLELHTNIMLIIPGTLQEFVLPKEVKLYCGSETISRRKLKSAIYIIFLFSTMSLDFEHELVPRKAFDSAFNRRRIHQYGNQKAPRGMGLVGIMAILGNHSASDSRDRIYSVLGLIPECDRRLIGDPEYSSSTEYQFARLVRSFWNEHHSLDIVCFTHIFNRYSLPEDPGPENAVPCWAPDWRVSIEFASPVPLMASQSATAGIGNFRPLRSADWKASYDAPGSQLRKHAQVSFSEDLQELSCNAAIIGVIHGLGGLDDRELRCQSFICKASGHALRQSQEPQAWAPRGTMLPMDWLHAIALSLVLDRYDTYLSFQAPQQYVKEFLHLCQSAVKCEPVDWSFSTWFDLNRSLMCGPKTFESLIKNIPEQTSLAPPTLIRPPSYPMKPPKDPDSDRFNTFLTRFHDTVRKKARRLMVTDEGRIGMAPCRAREGDTVAVLFGCSIPLVLRPVQDKWQIVGEAYVHDYMNGEVAGLIKRGKLEATRVLLV